MLSKISLLAYFPKLTYKRFTELQSVFSSFDEMWEDDKIKNVPWQENIKQEFLLWRDQLNAEEIEQTLQKEQITCVTLDDPDYPALLKKIYDPPICLFVRGTLPKYKPHLAVVGPRNYSAYGKQLVEELVTGVAKAGVVIVSGLAYGIDSIAHKTTLETGGITLAVLGGGNDRQHVAPAVHRGLSEEIIKAGGAVITEYPPGTIPTVYTFPKRNRIIAGLCYGTLVIEASEKSGSLITARVALDNGRDVLAVPQNITSPTAVGTNNLIKMGAHAVTSVSDILDLFNLYQTTEKQLKIPIKPASIEQAVILKQLSRNPVHIDELTRQSGLESRVVNSTLTLMEMKGFVRNVGGMNYIFAS